jgi:hypothetical protein
MKRIPGQQQPTRLAQAFKKMKNGMFLSPEIDVPF